MPGDDPSDLVRRCEYPFESSTMIRVIAQPFFAIVFVVSVVVGVHDTSHAQGTHGMLPDPIGLRETQILLERYAQVRPDQLPILEAVHNDYLQKCKVLREGPIKEYLEFMSRVSAARMGSVPDKKTIDSMLEQSNRVNQRIKETDDAFFRELRPLFDESQLNGLDRARLYRSRVRSLGGQFTSGFERSGAIDDIVWDTALTFEERALLDLALQRYEQSITNLYQKRTRRSEQNTYDMVESLIEAGFGDMTEESMMDPKYSQEFMDTLDSIMQESYAETFKIETDICQRNIVFIKDIRTLLPVEPAHRVYLKLSVWDSSIDPELLKPSIVHSRLKRIQVSESLTSDERKDIEDMASEWRIQDMNFIRTGIDLDNKLNSGFSFLVGDNLEELIASRYENFRKRGQASTALYERVRAMLGAKREERILKSSRVANDGEANGEDFPGIDQDELVGTQDLLPNLNVGKGRRESVVPDLMSADDLAIVTKILNLTDVEIPIVQAIFEQYQTDWQRQVRDREAKAHKLNLWTRSDTPDRRRRFDLNALKQKWAEIYAAYDASLKIDEQFFVDIGSLLEAGTREAKMAGARQFRRFARIDTHRFKNRSVMFEFGHQLYIPNPYRLPLEYEDDPSLMAELYTQLIDLRDDFGSVISDYGRQQLDATYEEALLAGEIRAAYESERPEAGVVVAAWQQEYESSLRKAIDALQDQLRRARKVQKIALEACAQCLDENQLLFQSVELLDEILGESGLRYALLEKIESMPDLSEQQREEILSLIEIHLQFEKSHSEARLDTLKIDERSLKKFSDTLLWMENIEQIKGQHAFERAEYQDRLMIRLSTLLTPIQRARIPALADTSVELVE